MNHKGLTVPMLVFLVAGCATMAPKQTTQQLATQLATEKLTPKPPATLSSEQVKIVERGVRDGLKDPASATFRGVFSAAGTPGGPLTVCGQVNAKNSFGGYTGYGPFMGVLSGSKFGLVASSVDDTKAQVILAMCSAEGAPIR